MYEYIKGALMNLTPTEAVVETGGIGYRILISLQTYSALSPAAAGHDTVQLHLHYLLREDEASLFGFADVAERALFQQLIGVSGVGPGTARMILSAMNVQEFQTAILTEDVNRIRSIKGIGIKTAQRIIVDLKDKVAKLPGTSPATASSPVSIHSETEEKACTALIMLGFQKNAVEKTVRSIAGEKPDATLEEIIKMALKRL